MADSLYWFAGLLEGEGCFTIYKNWRRRYYPMIQLAMTDQDIVERANVFTQTRRKIYPETIRRGCKQIFRMRIVGKDATRVMRWILPLMGDRRARKIAWILGLSEVE